MCILSFFVYNKCEGDMMYYEIDEVMKEVKLRKAGLGLLIGVITSEQLKKDNERYFGFSKATVEELEEGKNIRVVHKMDSYYGYCFGILHMLKQEDTGYKEYQIGVYMKANLLVIVCDHEYIRNEIKASLVKINPATCSLEHIISTVLEQLMREHHGIISHLEERIDRLDNRVMSNHMETFNLQIREIRKDILRLTHYFEQLIDVCDELLEDENDLFQEESIHHLRILSDRVNRFAGNVRLCREYMIQVRESYQSQVDINLNQIMYIFTVVTTIFLPLTLIVGWYGMNFSTMPEVKWRYGYVFVILLSLFIIVFCIWFFKKKKLFRK